MSCASRRVAASSGVFCLIAACGVPVAFASAPVTPPAGTPNMGAMVLQPSDLAPGASVAAQRYVAPPNGFTAEYAAVYTGATTTTDGTKFTSIEDDVTLASTATPGADLEASNQAVFATPSGRRSVIKAAIKAAGKKAHLKAKDFKFSPTASAGIGSASFVEIITLTDKHRSVEEGWVGFVDGDTYTGLLMVAKTIPQSDAIALAQTTDGHIHATLGSTGATGTTGTT